MLKLYERQATPSTSAQSAEDQLMATRLRNREAAQARQDRVTANLARVANEAGVVKPEDSRRVHTGEHPIVVTGDSVEQAVEVQHQ